MKANRNSVKPDWQFDGMTITVRMPMTFVRRGGRKVIVAPDGGDAWALAKPRPDEALIRRVGAGASVKVVAGGGEVSVRGGDRRGRRLTLSFATRLLRLTLLAPTSSRS